MAHRLSACLLFVLAIGVQGDPPPLNRAWFSYLHPVVKVDLSSRWLVVPWRTDLRAAVVEARRKRKPILLWSMNGSPYGCTCGKSGEYRETSFDDDAVIEVLQEKFIPVAVDAFDHQKRSDDAGEIYRKVVYQRPGLEASDQRSTQGFYVFAPNARLIDGWRQGDAKRLWRGLELGLAKAEFEAPTEADRADSNETVPALPDGAVVVNVFSRVLKANWPPSSGAVDDAVRDSTGWDRLWISKAECGDLAAGRMAKSLENRILLFHLVDNTRGEPPVWRPEEIVSSTLQFAVESAERRLLTGAVRLESKDGARRFSASVFGYVECDGERLTRFDVLVRGDSVGHGPGNAKQCPLGVFTLAQAFSIAPAGSVGRSVAPYFSTHSNYFPRN